MNNDIMYISNTLIYENYLKAANELIANQRLSLRLNESAAFPKEPLWIQEILKDQAGVMMVDTDRFKEWCNRSQQVTRLREKKLKTISFKKRILPSQRASSQSSRTTDALNESAMFEESDDIYLSERMEEDMAVLLIEKFINYGVAKNSVSVITPYNSERGYLYEKLEVLACHSEKRRGSPDHRQEPGHRQRHDRVRVPRTHRWHRPLHPQELAQAQRGLHTRQEKTAHRRVQKLDEPARPAAEPPENPRTEELDLPLRN